MTDGRHLLTGVVTGTCPGHGSADWSSCQARGLAVIPRELSRRGPTTGLQSHSPPDINAELRVLNMEVTSINEERARVLVSQWKEE